MPHEVFISYSSHDKKAADAACAVLEAHGIRCWIAPRDVPVGETWAEAILEAMQQARLMVLIFSKNANQSQQVVREVERAVGRGLPVVPVRLEDVLPAKALEYFISSSHWLDAFPPPVENYLNHLANAVRGFLDGKNRTSEPASLPRIATRRFPHYKYLAAAATVALVLLIGAFAYRWYDSRPPQFVVGAIKVPAKFTDATGMDGTVLAAHLLDRLNALEQGSEVYALRAADSFVGGWQGADNSRVEARVDPFGRNVLIGGDVVSTNGSWELSIRVSGHGAQTIPIGKDDLNTAINTAGDWVFQNLAPYRYAVVLGQRNHLNQEALFLKIAQTPQNPDHLWADSKLSENFFAIGHYDAACSAAEDEYTEVPAFIPAVLDLSNCRFGMGDLAGAQNLIRTAIERLSSTLPDEISRAAALDLLPQLRSRIAEFAGAWIDAITIRYPVRNSRVNYLNKKMPPWDASNYAQAHDVRKALSVMHEANMATQGQNAGPEDGKAIRQFQSIGFAPANFFVAAALDDWALAVSDLSLADKAALAFGNVNEVRHRYLWPWLAYSLARSGHLKAASALVAITPHDCYVCLQMRGRVTALSGDSDGAQYWFGRTIALAESLPFGYADWGAMLLHKGDYDAAIEKFTLANQKGSRFADPLELWGEALMLKGRSDLALAKFDDANHYAPNWGRLHMKWGEALGYVGRKAEARAQFQIASTLRLSVADQAELARDTRA